MPKKAKGGGSKTPGEQITRTAAKTTTTPTSAIDTPAKATSVARAIASNGS